jgi:hypothetical protein
MVKIIMYKAQGGYRLSKDALNLIIATVRYQ